MNLIALEVKPKLRSGRCFLTAIALTPMVP